MRICASCGVVWCVKVRCCVVCEGACERAVRGA